MEWDKLGDEEVEEVEVVAQNVYAGGKLDGEDIDEGMTEVVC